MIPSGKISAWVGLSASDAEVEEVAKAAGCDAFIRRLEMAMIRMLAVLVDTFPAENASVLPSPAPC